MNVRRLRIASRVADPGNEDVSLAHRLLVLAEAHDKVGVPGEEQVDGGRDEQDENRVGRHPPPLPDPPGSGIFSRSIAPLPDLEADFRGASDQILALRLPGEGGDEVGEPALLQRFADQFVDFAPEVGGANQLIIVARRLCIGQCDAKTLPVRPLQDRLAKRLAFGTCHRAIAQPVAQDAHRASPPSKAARMRWSGMPWL